VLDRRDGPGIGALTASPEQTFLALVGDWREARPSGALLCGMVGSRNGWVEAPYAPCPADAAAITRRIVHVEADGLPVAIVPGLSCVNPLGGPDVMRGEETQILGAMALHPELKQGRQLLALPGTHTKWVVVEDGLITCFLTAPVGEVFALLRDRSTLASAATGEDHSSPTGFALGLARLAEQGAARLPHLLFETRARQLVDGMARDDALGFLSGLLIGADVAAAADWHGPLDKLTLIGAPALTGLYGAAIAHTGGQSLDVDGDSAVLAGLTALSGQKNSDVHVLA
jgi:2-dehydro-3-deoxygalactonokinase